MRTPADRRRHRRAGLRHPSDLTDAERWLLEPLLPGAQRRGHGRGG